MQLLRSSGETKRLSKKLLFEQYVRPSKAGKGQAVLFICSLILLHQVSPEDTGRGRLLCAGTARVQSNCSQERGAMGNSTSSVQSLGCCVFFAGSLLLLVVLVFSLGLWRVGLEGKLQRILIFI